MVLLPKPPQIWRVPLVLIGLALLLMLVSIGLLVIPAWQPYDVQWIMFFAEHRRPEFTLLAQSLAWLGGMPAMIILTLVCTIYYYHNAQWPKMYCMWTAVFGSFVISWGLKFMFDRPRPDAMWAIFQSYGDAFPSGHSLYAASLAALLMLFVQNHTKRHIYFALAALWLVLMGLSRIYLGVHFLSDVLAGWALGLFWVSLVWLYFNRRFPQGSMPIP